MNPKNKLVTSSAGVEINDTTEKLLSVAKEIAALVERIHAGLPNATKKQELADYLHIFGETPLNELIHFKLCLQEEFPLEGTVSKANRNEEETS